MSITPRPSIVYLIYDTDSSSAVIAAHRLFMALMLHGYTSRMLQSQIDDAEKRTDMIENALRTADAAVVLISDSAAETGTLLAEQLEIARRLEKPIVELTLPINLAALLAQLDGQDRSLITDPPSEATWLDGAWRLKFFNESTLAHGYGILKLLPDGGAQGDLNIAQGTAALSTRIAARWTLEGKHLTLNGLQQVQGLPTRLEYKLEMEIQHYNGDGTANSVVAFSVKTAQGDDGVLQRAPESA